MQLTADRVHSWAPDVQIGAGRGRQRGITCFRLQSSIQTKPQRGRPPLIGCWWLYAKRVLQLKAAPSTLT
jgi:hypothetical protein